MQLYALQTLAHGVVVAQPCSLRTLATARDLVMQASCLVKRPVLLGCTNS